MYQMFSFLKKTLLEAFCLDLFSTGSPSSILLEIMRLYAKIFEFYVLNLSFDLRFYIFFWSCILSNFLRLYPLFLTAISIIFQ